jgi:hypothetical protein
MKRFVREEFLPAMAVAVATLAVVIVTGAGAAATYLICSGLLAIVIIWRSVHESADEAERTPDAPTKRL